MPKLSHLTGTGTSSASFEYEGETYNLKFHAIRYTPALVSELAGVTKLAELDGDWQALMEGGAARMQLLGVTAPAALVSLGKVLVRLVSWWDLTEEDGSMYPITEESLANLPFTFLVEVLGAIRNKTSVVPEGEVSGASN